MKARQLPAESYALLKAATRHLVRAAGGVEHAPTRVGKSNLSDYGSINKSETYIPIDVVADIEADLGDPRVTRALADLAGYDLVPRTGTELAEVDLDRMVSALGSRYGQLCQVVERMEADGIRERHELRAAVESIDALIHVATRKRDAMVRALNGVGRG